ncbi:MAG: hypothetical protein EOP83_19915, partial [Verrucomicrobiaceae bacterium]
MITHSSGLSRLASKITALFLATIPLGLSAATPAKTVNASATLAYNIKGLNHNLAIQKAYIASTYVYVTQRSGGTVYLSRCLISGNNATYQDEMTMTNCGHGQTLDMYTYNDINYLYVSSKADPATSYYWSLQVARTLYTAGTTVDYTSLRRFTYMNYANKTGARLGTTYRVDAGGNSTHTAFRVQTEEGTVTWSIYDTVDLNQLLDGSTQVQMDSDAAQNACVYSFTQSGSNIIRPNGSFQGADLLGSTEIYTSGGAEGETPSIAMISNTGAYKSLVKITNVGNREIEGVQTKNGNVY